MKRLFDFTVSLVLLLLFAPILVFVAIAIRWTMGNPVFFFQERPGLKGKAFRIVKFRTMTTDRNHDGKLASDAARLTRLGKFLRATSLDELPELWNVLVGEMSLVGPRPLLMQYLPLYSQRQSRRHDVRPGITGWAQVNGRNAVSWPDRFELDVWYVENQTLWLDLKILAMTFWKVIQRDGISAPGQATMDFFRGNESEANGNATNHTNLHDAS